MTTSTTRQTFRALVADVAARATARLPEAVNGRVESAARLVFLHDVTPQADGSILVGSSSDPMKQYRLEGTTCTCQDFVQGKAPEGWCQHRIAAGIAKRVRELLPVVPESVEPWSDHDPGPGVEAPERPVDVPYDPTPAPTPLPEAPASVNVRVTISGREVQWTLRDTDEGRLAVRLEALLQRYPLPQPQPLAPAPSPAATTPQCPTHGAAKPSTKGQGWYCPHKRDDGTWCPWKSKGGQS